MGASTSRRRCTSNNRSHRTEKYHHRRPLLRCQSSARVAATSTAIQAWRAAEPLTTRLPVATITKQADFIHSIGAFSTTFKDQVLYRRKLVELLQAQSDLSRLELDAADLEQPSQFDQTTVPAAQAAAARGGGAAGGRRGRAAAPQPNAPAPVVQALAGPASLKYLTLVRASDLFDDEAELPAEPLMRLWAMLPDRCSDAERRDPRSRTRANAEIIQAGVAKLTMVAAPSDALLGACVASFARGALKFPLAEFQADEFSLNAFNQELRDAISFTQGAEIDVARVVTRRLLHARRKYPELIGILETINDSDGRTLQLERLATVACPGRHSQPLRFRLPDLEEFVVARAAAITQAKNAGKVGAAIVDLLLTDAKDVGTEDVSDAAKNTGERADGEAFGAVGAGLSLRAFGRARNADAFVQAAAQIAALDANDAADRRQIIEIATGAQCALFQQTLDHPASLKGRDEALGALHASAIELPVYIGQRQAMNDATGKVDPLLKEWCFDQSQCDLLVAGRLTKLQLVNPPFGVIALLNLSSSEPYEPVPEEQIYITESVLQELAPFGHKTLVAWGAPAISSTGYTFQTLCEKQKEYVLWVKKQGDAVQADLLPHADATFREALKRIELNLRAFLTSSDPANARLPHLLPFGEAYDQALEAKREAVAPLITLHRALPGLIAKSSPRSLPGVVLPNAAIKSEEEREERDKGKGKRIVPGSKKDVPKWIDDDHLKFGLYTYDIAAYSKELGLTEEQSKHLCWPVITSNQKGDAVLAFCPSPKASGHQGLKGEAHRRPKGFKLSDLCSDKFCKKDKRPHTNGAGGSGKRQKK